MSMFGLAAAAVFIGAPVPLWVTFDVANPGTTGGHRIVHLEDLVGPDRRADIPSLPNADRAMLFSVRAEDCEPEGLCGEVATWVEPLLPNSKKPGVLVVAVVPTERERADAVRARMAAAGYRFAVSVDPYGVVTRLAGLDRPGTFVVVDRKGRTKRWTPGPGRATLSSRAFDEIRALLTRRGPEELQP